MTVERSRRRVDGEGRHVPRAGVGRIGELAPGVDRDGPGIPSRGERRARYRGQLARAGVDGITGDRCRNTHWPHRGTCPTDRPSRSSGGSPRGPPARRRGPARPCPGRSDRARRWRCPRWPHKRTCPTARPLWRRAPAPRRKATPRPPSDRPWPRRSHRPRCCRRSSWPHRRTCPTGRPRRTAVRSPRRKATPPPRSTSPSLSSWRTPKPSRRWPGSQRRNNRRPLRRLPCCMKPGAPPPGRAR